jgi:hypothetical protein
MWANYWAHTRAHVRRVWQTFEVYTGRVILPLVKWWCKMDGHCIREHEARRLSKETTKPWETILRHSALLGDVATFIGVAQEQCILEVFCGISTSESQCYAPLHEECPKYHGHKEDLGMTLKICGASGEKAQMILVWVKVPSVGNASNTQRLGITRVNP